MVRKKKKKSKKLKKSKNKSLALIGFVSALFITAFIFYKTLSKLPQTHVIFPNSQKILVDVAADEKSRKKGLMFRKRLNLNEGMLFVYNDNAERFFWMKNTFLDLDIIFIGEDFIINEIFENVKKSGPGALDLEIAKVSASGKYVLEIAAGSVKKHLLKSGLKVEIVSKDKRQETRGKKRDF